MLADHKLLAEDGAEVDPDVAALGASSAPRLLHVARVDVGEDGREPRDVFVDAIVVQRLQQREHVHPFHQMPSKEVS